METEPEPSEQAGIPSLGFLQETMQFLSNNAFVLSVVLLIGIGLLTASYAAINYIARRIDQSQPATEIVAQITDVKDCRWRRDESPANKADQLPAGRQLDIERGLVQITYENGAVVLLEGPASFTVDSWKSGTLARGRLSVRAETEQSHGFTINAPHARFTDLGTNFGIKTDAQEDAEIHVFQGTVEVRDAARENLMAAVRLTQGKAARIGANRQVEYLPQADPNEFVLRMDAPRKKQLDLLDIVAGGDGTDAAWKECGIDPVTGNRDAIDAPSERTGDGVYHLTSWQPFVDGVFLPTGMDTKLDSAGHAYDFPKTDNMISKCIYAIHRGDDPNKLWGSAGNGQNYMPSGRGLLCIHANAGITFDMEAMRKAHPGWMPVKFAAVAGNVFDFAKTAKTDNYNESADVWVFVDGKLRFHHSELSRATGPVPVNVPIAPTDRYLTLVTTDRIGNHRFAQIVFGDPVLNLEAGP
jgi:hypothetical protein